MIFFPPDHRSPKILTIYTTGLADIGNDIEQIIKIMSNIFSNLQGCFDVINFFHYDLLHLPYSKPEHIEERENALKQIMDLIKHMGREFHIEIIQSYRDQYLQANDVAALSANTHHLVLDFAHTLVYLEYGKVATAGWVLPSLFYTQAPDEPIETGDNQVNALYIPAYEHWSISDFAEPLVQIINGRIETYINRAFALNHLVFSNAPHELYQRQCQKIEEIVPKVDCN